MKNDEIISTGYNGSPRDAKNCCDIGFCIREKDGIPHGIRYEMCPAVHAEANAIISSSRRDMLGATLYLAGLEANGTAITDAKPCYMCYRLILNAGISAIITKNADGLAVRKEVKNEELRTLL